MDFDYRTPAELFLSKRTGRGHTKYRRFATAAEAIRYAVEDLPALRPLVPGCRLGMSASTVTKSNDCMTIVIIRCANL